MYMSVKLDTFGDWSIDTVRMIARSISVRISPNLIVSSHHSVVDFPRLVRAR
jgi:hypothetical protein